jgi:hypothetical protein
MIYHLVKRRNAGTRLTNAIVVRIIRATVETGFITAAAAVVDLALFLSYKDVNYYITPGMALSKLYSNSLMAVSTSI